MRIFINIVPDIEEIMIEKMQIYLHDEVRFDKIFPNFGNVRVGGTHPFSALIDNQVNGTDIPVGLFPSVTFVAEMDMKNPQIGVPVIQENVTIGEDEISEMENASKRKNEYIMSDDDLLYLKEAVSSSEEPLIATGYTQYKRCNCVMEVWADNILVKNRLYDLLQNFLIGEKRFTIKEEYNIVVDENSITGEKSGNYNYDFGKILHGGFIRFHSDYSSRQYIFDSEIGVLESVDHFEVDINPENGG